MKRTKSLAVVAGFAMVTLAACGGSGDGKSADSGNKDTFIDPGSSFEQIEAEGPAPEVEGATTGGTITVLVPSDPGPEDLDPTNGWSVLGNSIQQALTNRSLTQYRRNADTGAMELVPDLATDLGTPNEDFTEWKFTIKDVKWENGNPVTAEEVKNGILRSFDTETFTSGPGQAYTVGWVDCPEDYAGPTKSGDCDAVQADGQDLTIRTSKSFPDFNFWSTFMAIGPIPLKNSDFPAYGRKPLSTGPYKIKEFRVNESLTLVKNDQWDPASDPARHQYADEWVIKFDQDQEKVDQILLSGNAGSATTITNGLGATNANELKSALGANYIQQTGQCINNRTPDYTKITDINIRKAIAWAYDFENITLAGGNIPGVTRIPGSSIMPPGMAGRKEFFADGEQFTYDAGEGQGPPRGGRRARLQAVVRLRRLRPRGRCRRPGGEEGLRAGWLHRRDDPLPGGRLRPLGRPGQPDQQEAEPAFGQLVLGLAGRLDDDPAADRDRSAVQHVVLLRAGGRRPDPGDHHPADRGPGCRLG